ncbi:helix-turn-helix domain-containing protein [Streptomyces sp. NPDC060011]|uniref:helix-turn-helix domain-containing protein n=1 Tax=Streptomyces sp. NPDC060011 TaxID=3347037 RepID=UPI003688A9B8
MDSDAQLSDLRVACGLTMKELAGRLGIAVNTYRQIELKGVLPRRRPGVIWDLADALRVDYNRLRRALHRIPQVRTRRQAAGNVVRRAAELAVSRGGFAPLDDSSDEAQFLAVLFGARPAVVSRLLNIYLTDLRELAARQAQAQARLDFSVNPRWDRHYEVEVQSLDGEIDRVRHQGPELLEQYLTNPMSQQSWQTLVTLYTTGPGGLDPSLLDPSAVHALERIFDFYLIERTLTGITLSTAGVLFFTDTLPYYRAVYPVEVAIRPDSQSYGWPSLNIRRASTARRHLRNAHVLGHDPHPLWNDIRGIQRRLER